MKCCRINGTAQNPVPENLALTNALSNNIICTDAVETYADRPIHFKVSVAVILGPAKIRDCTIRVPKQD